MATLVVSTLLLASVPVQGQSPPLPGLGMDQGSVKGLQDGGAPPVYGSYWVGHWMAKYGWGGFDNALASAKATGVTPVVYWYYWGDSISPSCVENGCDGRSKAEWVSMTQTLADKVRDALGGAPAIIVLENEFNKGGVTSSTYAPTFDAYLEARAKTLKAVPGVHVSLGFGSWGEDVWSRFPKAMAASDSIGFQLMRASTRDSEAQYRGAPDKIASVLAHVKAISGKPAFLYDVALSSYPDATWRGVQADTLGEILERRPEYGQNGLVGMVYRELKDNPSMGTHNYYGIAEQFWGLRDTHGNPKPAWDAWKAASGATPPPPTPPATVNVPGSFEAEAMTATTGGRTTDASASGGAVWNVWTNGHLRQDLVSDGGAFRVTVMARGTSAGGVDARMDVRLDGAVLGAFTVPAGGLRAYVVEAQLPRGASTLAVAFTNDALVGSEDRNLLVDVVRVEAPAANQPPVARMAASVADLTVAVDAAGSSDPEGDALSFAWDFGDGAKAAGATATHAYAAPGEYVVTLRASDGRSASTASATVTARAPNRAPLAAFEATGADLAWRFDAAGSSDPDGDALAYAWTFGDGGTATGPVVGHAYATAGDRTVTLTVSDGKTGSTATRLVSARAPNRAPVAAFSASGQDLSWTFDAGASTDPDGDALSHLWTFPDGTTATGARASKTFATSGDHVVRLQVLDGRGGSGWSNQTIAARAPAAIRAMEAEAFAAKDNGAGFADSTASGGKGWLLWSNGAMRQAFTPGAGTWLVQVVAKGDQAAGAPVMELRADDVVVGRWSVAATAWTTYAAPVAFKAGETRTLSVHFTNDHRTAFADRNLRVDMVRMIPAASAVAVEGETFAAKDNGAAFGDGAASGDAAWLLWSNGAMRHAVDPGSGTHRVEIRAKGDPSAGWPIMELRADGALVGRWTVGSSTWQTYAADVTFGTAARQLSVHFVNDHVGAEGDRNLRVDLVRVTPQ